MCANIVSFPIRLTENPYAIVIGTAPTKTPKEFGVAHITINDTSASLKFFTHKTINEHLVCISQH